MGPRTIGRSLIALSVIAVAIIVIGYALTATRRAGLVRVKYTGLPPYDDPHLVAVWVDDGGGPRSVSGDTLAASTPVGAVFPVRTRGVLRMRVTLAARETLAVDSIALELHPDMVIDFVILAGASDSLLRSPMPYGVARRRGVPIRSVHPETARDSMWIVWGANSLSHPVLTSRDWPFPRRIAARRPQEASAAPKTIRGWDY